MTELRQRMLEELQRRNYSKETIRLYLFAVKDFARHFKKRPDLLRQEHMREFQLHLPNERKLAVETVAARITALRFFFVKVLHRPYQELDLIYPKLPVRLPTVLSEDEVAKLIESASSAYHRTIVGISGVPVVESRQAAGRECRIWSFMIWAAQERAISRVTQPARSLSRLKRPFPSKASAASLLPLLLGLLPGGANQFPGGTFTRCGPAPFRGARSKWSMEFVGRDETYM